MNLKEKEQQIDQIFEKYKEDLKTLVAANSANAKAEEAAPFGKGVREALAKAIEIAEKFGFRTYTDPEGYYGYAEVGEGEELFGVLGHLDVVPSGPKSDWQTDPFVMTEKDGKLYGRGTQDDKGPLLASMYALKLLLDGGAKLDRRVRFIFGTNEESLWGGIKAYVKKEEHPALGFTPDSSFPLNYAEKGLINYELTMREVTDAVFLGGTAYNAVPAEATTAYDKSVEDALKSLGYKYIVKDNVITVIGKTMHAMAADKGINAVVRLAEAMRKAGKDGAMLRFLTEKGNNPHGSPIFGDISDDISGKLMFNVGVAKLEKDSQMIGIDMRTPVTYEKEKADEAIEKAAKSYGISVRQYDYLRPIHIDVNSELVKSLMRAYREVTGDEKSQPAVSGGATYARAMDNIVAFGANFPGHEATDHQANEHASIEDLKKAMLIYMRAFELLVTK